MPLKAGTFYSIFKEHATPGQQERPWGWSPMAGTATAKALCDGRAGLEFRGCDIAAMDARR